MYWERERSSASASLLISARMSSSIVMLIFSFNGFTYLTSSLSYHKMRHSIDKYDKVGKNTTKYKTMITWIVLWKDHLLLPFAFCFFYLYLFGLPLWLRQSIFLHRFESSLYKTAAWAQQMESKFKDQDFYIYWKQIKSRCWFVYAKCV